MTRLLALAVPFVLVAAFLPAAPIPRDGGKQEYYFPTRVGTKWVYDLKGGEGYGKVITESKEKDGRYHVTVKTTSVDFKDDASTTISRYAVSKEGVFAVAEGLESETTRWEYDRPFCLLKLPHQVGEKWEGDPKTGDPPRIAGKVETIKVPAGTFEAIRVDVGKDGSSWYALGVGQVKSRSKDLQYEMKSFTLPKE